MAMRSWPLFVVLVACAPEGRDPLEGADPRCASLCKIVEPPLSGAYEKCSDDSARSCVDMCESRIATVDGGCATCLLSNASFGSGPIDAEAECTGGGTCTIEGPGGSCTYVAADPEDRDRCTRIAFPRTVVDCPTIFQTASNCTTTCS